MSSIFSYDPSPPKPQSPWRNSSRGATPLPGVANNSGNSAASSNDTTPPPQSSLHSEPQVGSTEYKLHLLRAGKSAIRITQLTTQLLWRLQQSNPNFSAVSSTSSSAQQIRDALQDSQGALYELGVGDDGTFVGLLEDELQESLDTLREMAARLGCGVWVLRKVKVGEYVDQNSGGGKVEALPTTEKGGEYDDREDMGRWRAGKSGPLWVAEAFVKPIISKDGGIGSPGIVGTSTTITTVDAESVSQTLANGVTTGATVSLVSATSTQKRTATPFSPSSDDSTPPSTDQLKISLTGTTTAGKSTLLGTLTTSQADNGRGKSRLRLFRHRHELVSGVTSSVAQEIVGYKPYKLSEALKEGGEVVNYSYGNISSWTDVHTAINNASLEPFNRDFTTGGSGADVDGNESRDVDGDKEKTDSQYPGRIVFLSDTAGHPRYRRTTIRSLVGWAPHYALLLIPGDEDISESSQRHLQLVLKLNLRLIVLITKLDIARREVLRKVLSGVLAGLRKGGREPAMVNSVVQGNFAEWSGAEEGKVREVMGKMEEMDRAARERGETGEDVLGGGKMVPVVFVSAVSGQGIGCLHALLRGVPLPPRPNRTAIVDHLAKQFKKMSLGKEDDMAKDTTGDKEQLQTPPDQLQPIQTLFHVEEVYALPKSYTFFPEMTTSSTSSTVIMTPDILSSSSEGAIVSGHLRYGQISVGDELVVGPFRTSTRQVHSHNTAMKRSESLGSLSVPTPHRKSSGAGGGDTSDHPQSGPKHSVSATSIPMVSSTSPVGDSSGHSGEAGSKYLWKPHNAHVQWLSDEEGSGSGTCGRSGRGGGGGGMSGISSGGSGDETMVMMKRKISRDKRKTGGGSFPGGGLDEDVAAPGVTVGDEWKLARVVSVRRLRLPVGTLFEGEAGTVGLVCMGGYKPPGLGLPPPEIVVGGVPAGDAVPGLDTTENETASTVGGFRLRKGMVVVNPAVSSPPVSTTTTDQPIIWPKSYTGFVTELDYSGGDVDITFPVGNNVVVYCASIRAAARVVEIPLPIFPDDDGEMSASSQDQGKKRKKVEQDMDVFNFDVSEDEGAGDDCAVGMGTGRRKCAFEFLGGGEWVEVGAKVLVVADAQGSGGGGGRGLENVVVGRVVRVGL